MKKILSLLIAITLLCGVFGGFGALAAKVETKKGELVLNGDMELLGTPYGFWNGAQSADRVSTKIFRSGERAMRLSASDGTRQIITQQIYDVIPGKNYVFSAYLYINELLDFSPTDIGGILKIEFYKNDGNGLPGSAWGCFTGKTGKWMECEIEAIAPEEVGYISLQLRLDCGGEIFWDDASLTGELPVNAYNEIENKRALAAQTWEHSNELLKVQQEKDKDVQIAPGIENAVRNPGFEELTADGSAPAGWVGWKGEWGKVTFPTDEDAHSGNRSAKIEFSDPSYHFPYMQAIITDNLIGGTDYVFSAWAKMENMAALNGVIMKYEAYSSDIASTETFVGSGDSSTYVLEEGVWQQIKYVFTLPEGTTNLRAYIRSTGPGTVYYDDVEFGPTGSSAAMNFYTKDVFYYTEDNTIGAYADIAYINNPIENGNFVEFTIKDDETVIASEVVQAAPSVQAEFDVMTLAEKGKKYTISAAYKKADGTVIETSSAKRIYRYDRPTALNEKGQYLDENGEPMNIVYLYGGFEEYLDDYVKAGINVIRMDDFKPLGASYEKTRDFLDKAHARGIKVLFQLYGDCAGHPFQIPTTKRFVNEFKDHPAIFGWMMVDEPSYQVGSNRAVQTFTEILEYLEEGYRVIREIDPVHPIYNIETTGVAMSYEQTFQLVDVCGIDIYPYPSDATYQTYKGAKRAVNAVYDEKPVWLLGYAADWTNEGSGWWIPDENEIRMSAVSGLWAGTDGVGYYTDKKVGAFVNEVYTRMNQSGELGQWFKHFVREEAPKFDEYIGYDYWMRSWVDEGKLYILLREHKNDGKETPVSFKVKSTNGLIELNGFTAKLVNGPTAQFVVGEGSEFNLTLKPLEVATYVIDLPSDVDVNLLNQPIYSDLGDHMWATDAIEKTVTRGVSNDKGAGIYAPGENITRGDFAMYLVRTLGLTEYDEGDQFTDVDPNAYYAKEIAIGKKAGILKGTGDGTYHPEEPISRQDLMVICARGLRSLNKISTANPDSALKNFSDMGLIADYALADVASMVASGKITGNADMTINPLGNTTRAEAAVIMSRILPY